MTSKSVLAVDVVAVPGERDAMLSNSVKNRSIGEQVPPLPTVGDNGVQTRTPLVQVEGLVKHYDKVVALDGIDLTIYEREFLVLLGPSGCGKTTTMMCIAGLERPNSGSIIVGGRTFFDAKKRIDVPPNKRGIGMVFQSYALWPHKSVVENVIFPLRMQKVPRQQAMERALEVLALVGLDGYAHRSINTLSGGQMQRVALARAVVANPGLLLLDEPLSNLDAKLRLRLRHELKELQDTLGVTTILVTHDQSEALGLADRIVVMDKGRVVQVGTPQELYTSPKNLFVADFLGMTNRIPVVISEASEGWAVGTIKGASAVVRGIDRRQAKATTTAALCFRPVTGTIFPAGQVTQQQDVNLWPGRVLSTQYQGVGYQVRVKLDGGPVVHTHDQSSQPYRVGDECVLAVPGHDCLIFDDDPDV
jgi:iron(III) transport system ATP-binding protein